MATTTKRNGFRRGFNGSTYTCTACGRRTRNTKVQSFGSTLCPQCYELGGIENNVLDGWDCGDGDMVADLLDEVLKRGGSIENWRATVINHFPKLAARY